MDISVARQIASFAGALLMLVAHVGHHMSWMDSRKAGYNVIAFRPFQVGFVVLEATWVLISLYALARPRGNE